MKLILCCYRPLSHRVFGGESSAAQFEHLTELQRGAVFKAALQDFNERALCEKANEADQAVLSATAAEKEALALILGNEGEAVSDAEVLMLLRQDIWPETLPPKHVRVKGQRETVFARSVRLYPLLKATTSLGM